MEEKMETTVTYTGYIGIMENTTETTVTYRGYIGIKWKLLLHIGVI